MRGKTGFSHSLCPVSRLRVLTSPDWTNLDFGQNYRLTLRVIGGRILHSRPSGYGSMHDAKYALGMTAEVSEQVFAGRPYVQIEDYRHLKSSSLEARRYFIQEMKKRSNIIGLVFCGASPLMRLSIKLGRRLALVAHAEVHLVDDYRAAIACATDILRRQGAPVPEPAHPNESLPITEAATPGGGVRPVLRVVELDGFSCSFEVINGDILAAEASGLFREHHVAPLFEVMDEMAKLMSSSPTNFSCLFGLTEVDRASFQARQRYVEAIRAWYRSHPFHLLVFYGANFLLQTAINIARPFVRLRVRVARDREAGLEMIRLEHGKQDSAEPTPLSVDPALTASGVDLYVNDLLKCLGNIDWESTDTSDLKTDLEPNHPFEPVFDAIALIRNDVQQLLREMRLAEEALRTSQERYRTIIDSIVDGYYEVDLAGTLTFCNDALLRIAGRPRGDLIGSNTRSYLEPNAASLVFEVFSGVHRSGEAAHAVNIGVRRPDGTRVSVEASVALIRDATGTPTGFRGIVRDVTEREQAAAERARLETKLQRAQRLQAVGTLAGGIAHNFNNILMGIQGNASMIMVAQSEESPHRERLQNIEKLVESGARLTTQLLAYARERGHEDRVLNLNSVISETTGAFAAARREIRVHQSLAEHLLPVMADQGQIEQVLLNLFVNAAEAMPAGGELFIESRNAADDERPSQPEQIRQGPHVVLTVRDTGVGIDAEVMEHIFEPFFTTKGQGKGIGLGLASVYGIVNAHGGAIDVTSAPGAGAEFVIFLPACEDQEAAHQEPAGEVVRGLGTILLIDDDDIVLEAVAGMLSSLSYTPLLAASGAQAIELFADHHKGVDLVILDLILGDMPARDVFDRLRRIDPTVRVLLASGYGINGPAQELLDAGCNDFIQKPFTFTSLSHKLEAIFGSTEAR